jgi:glycosyltransferase involved in cell wall biosynthesis
MRLGFACVWDENPRKTWSYTPWDLREALRRRSDVEVVDIGFHPPKWLRRALQLMALKRRNGRWIKPWEHVRVWEKGVELETGRRAQALRCDAVLQIQDLGAISTPYLIYQDFSYDIILECLSDQAQLGLREYFPHLDHAAIMRRRARQLRVYKSASRLLTMSEFLRQSLIERTHQDPRKVVTVWPGVSSLSAAGVRQTQSPRRRLLFVGTTFRVKGGDVVIAAFEKLRERHPDMTLSIVGLQAWPLPTPMPAGVNFIGRVKPEQLSEIYLSHDLMVVPSRLEGFGKVFIEALSHGLPCIGRRAFAMPELIEAGVTGDLLERDDPAELATRIENVLANDEIYRNCEAKRASMLATFNWDRAARDVATAAADAVRERAGTATR